MDSGAVRFAERNVITGNNLIGDATRQAKYHIWEDNANSDFNLISNNICRGGGTLDIVINGKSTNAFNNQVSTPYHEQRILNYKNTFGFDLGEGTVVILKSVAAGNEVDLTEVQGNDKVLGIVADEILDGAYGGIKVLGLTTLLSVNGVADIAIGDFLGTYTQFGVSMKAAAGDMAYAIALEAYANNDSDGRIDALIVCPRKI